MQLLAIAIARCVLPVPVPPTSTTLRCWATNPPPASSLKGLVNRHALELEVVEVLGEWQLGDGELVLDRARLLLADLGREQIADDALGFMLAFDGSSHDLIEGSFHAEEFELAHEVEELGSFHQMVLLRLSYRAQSAMGAWRSVSAAGVWIVAGGVGSRWRAKMLRTTSAEWTP